ncbi:hypothetical protein RRG08_031229 [Elysia crispata]|uniref:Uncharacterized protein n=1 Tax=Elysia crispata TaxID=231223 RepID=A0AAE1AJ25_9GAST|nr:hypothetical protein RRG08_031229 [Elysia crispata]
MTETVAMPSQMRYSKWPFPAGPRVLGAGKKICPGLGSSNRHTGLSVRAGYQHLGSVRAVCGELRGACCFKRELGVRDARSNLVRKLSSGVSWNRLPADFLDYHFDTAAVYDCGGGSC